MTDPRYTDPRQSDPVLARDETTSGIWGWVAGLAILALIAFVVVAGWHSDRNTASNNSPAPATSAQRSAPTPSTTGSGLTSPQPTTPSTPAPANRGTR